MSDYKRALTVDQIWKRGFVGSIGYNQQRTSCGDFEKASRNGRIVVRVHWETSRPCVVHADVRFFDKPIVVPSGMKQWKHTATLSVEGFRGRTAAFDWAQERLDRCDEGLDDPEIGAKRGREWRSIRHQFGE